MAKKLPLGIMPEVIWLEIRMQELARAVYQYVKIGDYYTSHDWADELNRRFNDRKEFFDKHPDIVDED